LRYLERALAIQQAIGDRSGEGTTLNNISQIYDARGDYDAALRYLERALAIRQAIGDRRGEGVTLNNISQIYKARGDYEAALRYLERSLAIRQAIGDAAGWCATLFNIGHIRLQNGQPQEAVAAWLAVYRQAQKMNLAQALQALAGLAPQLGLPGGLAAWEELSRRQP
jgi:tetratricopeptide (TPR) repeat protein